VICVLFSVQYKVLLLWMGYNRVQSTVVRSWWSVLASSCYECHCGGVLIRACGSSCYEWHAGSDLLP
jgi:hypothetical protein